MGTDETASRIFAIWSDSQKKDESLEKYYLLSDVYISIVYYELLTLWSNGSYVETENKKLFELIVLETIVPSGTFAW